MKNDMTIEQLLEAIDAEMAWFHSDDFKIQEASERFRKVKGLSERAEKILNDMKHEIEVLGEQ